MLQHAAAETAAAVQEEQALELEEDGTRLLTVRASHLLGTENPAAKRARRQVLLVAALFIAAPVLATTAASRTLERPPPPPEPPVSPPSAPLTPVERLNERFERGQPGSDLARAGVLVHQFDTPDAVRYNNPWRPCPADKWCSKWADRYSTSIINRRIPHVFSADESGFVVRPLAVEILCAWSQDGGSMGRRCPVAGDLTEPLADEACGRVATRANFEPEPLQLST